MVVFAIVVFCKIVSVNCQQKCSVEEVTVFSRIKAAASIKIFVQKCCFHVRTTSIYGIFYNNPGLSNMVSAL